MTRARPFLIAAILVLQPVLFAQLCSAQYFSSFGAKPGAPPEARQASANAIAGLAGVLTGLSSLESKDDAGARAGFDAAARALAGSIASFSALGRSSIAGFKVDLQKLHPDERTFIADPGLLALGTRKLDTAGDVFALTAGALSVALTNLNAFRQNSSVKNYAVVRDDMALLLRIGQVTTELLDSAH